MRSPGTLLRSPTLAGAYGLIENGAVAIHGDRAREFGSRLEGIFRE